MFNPKQFRALSKMAPKEAVGFCYDHSIEPCWRYLNSDRPVVRSLQSLCEELDPDMQAAIEGLRRRAANPDKQGA